MFLCLVSSIKSDFPKKKKKEKKTSLGVAKAGNLKLDFMAKSIGIHFFEYKDMFRCLRDNEDLKKNILAICTL